MENQRTRNRGGREIIVKDIIGRQFKPYGKIGQRVYYVDVDRNTYAVSAENKIFFTGTLERQIPFEEALTKGKIAKDVFEVVDWSPMIFTNY